MIIDAHAHFLDKGWLPSWAWDMLNELAAPRFGISVEEMARRREAGCDASGDTMVKCMDDAGVDREIGG